MVVYATQSDIPEIKAFDKHISDDMLAKAISDRRVLVFKSADILMGIARWNYFWDSIPFLNMLFVTVFFSRDFPCLDHFELFLRIQE